jgi:hypothetical protein
MKVKGNHPLAEIIARCLFGVENYPSEIRRAVSRACRKAVEWHELEVAKAITSQQAREELEADGVDVDASFKRVMEKLQPSFEAARKTKGE